MEGKEKKKSKRQSPSRDKDVGSQKFWPDLPQELVHKIAWNPMLLRDICYKGVTKSWRAEPSTCNSPNPTPPSLQLIHDDNQPASFNIRFKRFGLFYFYWRREKLRPDPRFQFLGSSHGQLVTKRHSASASGFLGLSNPVGWLSHWLPDWDVNDPFLGAFLSSSPDDRYPSNKCPTICTVIVLTGITHPAFAFYRISTEQKMWIKEDCTIVDPNCSRRHNFMRLTNGIWFKGKFYALSLQGTLAVIEEIDSRFRITDLGKKRVVPSVSSIRFQEYLVESDGEVLLVFLIYRKSIENVDEVEVYRLDTAKLAWIKKESLGDSTLFLGSNSCMSVSATRVGCRRDCVYFTSGSVGVWWVYDMGKRTISPGANDSTLFGVGCSLPRTIKSQFASEYYPQG